MLFFRGVKFYFANFAQKQRYTPQDQLCIGVFPGYLEGATVIQILISGSSEPVNAQDSATVLARVEFKKV